MRLYSVSSYCFCLLVGKPRLVIVLFTLSFVSGLFVPINSYVLKNIVNVLSSKFVEQDVLFFYLFALLSNHFILNNLIFRLIGFLMCRLTIHMKEKLVAILLDNQYSCFIKTEGEVASKLRYLTDSLFAIVNIILIDLPRVVFIVIVANLIILRVNAFYPFIYIAWLFLFIILGMGFHNRISSLSSEYYQLDNGLTGSLARFVSQSHGKCQKEIFSQALHCLHSYNNRETQYILYSAFQGLMVLSLVIIDVFHMPHGYIKNPGEFLLLFTLNLELAQISWFLMAKWIISSL